MALKEYKRKYDWVQKLSHLELCKWLNFDHVDKWYMHRTESLKENDKNCSWILRNQWITKSRPDDQT